jgi:hypothetical protein
MIGIGPGRSPRTIIATAEIRARPRPRIGPHVSITGAIAHATRGRSRGAEEQTPISRHVPTGQGNAGARARPDGVVVQIVGRLGHLVLVVQLMVVGRGGASCTTVGGPGNVEAVGEDEEGDEGDHAADDDEDEVLGEGRRGEVGGAGSGRHGGRWVVVATWEGREIEWVIGLGAYCWKTSWGNVGAACRGCFGYFGGARAARCVD